MASSNARKRAARDHQRRFPGTPYPVALRAVSHAESSLQVVIGEAAGRPYWVDIEELSCGGNGPHMAVIGPSRIGRRRVIELMVDSLAARPPRRGVEVLTVQGGDAGRINNLIEERRHAVNHAGARDFRELRRVQDARSGDPTEAAPAVVVVVDGDHLIDGLAPVETREGYVSRARAEETLSALDGLLRCGRALDIHTVLSVREIEANPWLGIALANISSIVDVDDSGSAANWRDVGAGRAPVEVALPAKATE